jgi:hypothetical protein
MTKFWLVPALLLWGGSSVFGFSLAGPIANLTDSYQTPTLGYNLGPPTFSQDIVAPKNLGEGYRWNTRNVYYAFDTQFLQYFGTNGAAQVDAAFAILNSLSNVDAYTPTLSEWPLQSGRVNFDAAQVGMIDVKSFVLMEMMEQLGLAEPDRYTYCLRDRIATGPCPNFDYNVIQRNYDPVTQVYSSYVNGVLYSFTIIETCADNPNPFANLISDAATVVVDPEQVADSMSAVAAGQFNGFSSVVSGNGPNIDGRYFLGLTRDDVGGLRYLWSSNSINNEMVDPNSLLQAPPSQPSLVVTSNLAVLQAAALTNNQTALQALFPALEITSATNLGFGFVLTTNIVAVVTPVNGGYYGQMQTNLVPEVTTNLLPTFAYTFGNVVTNFTFTNGGVLASNLPGEYLLVPANQCGFNILSNALTSVVISTNTNQVVTVFTNHALIVNIFTCTPNSVGLREGIEKVNFLRVDYDSLVGTNWGPVTNTYTLTAITNNQPVTQTFFRVINQPDILIAAGELDDDLAAHSTPNFNQSQALSLQAGPGTISPQVVITLSKVGPIFEVANPSFLISENPFNNTPLPSFGQWASFDGTTNAPVVYPVSNSYQNLVNSIFLQITVPGSPPNGIVSQPYSFELQASGATPPPYIYSVVAGSLPNGLNLVTSGGNTFISGTPTATGIFDFAIQVADSTGRATSRNFVIEIDP